MPEVCYAHNPAVRYKLANVRSKRFTIPQIGESGLGGRHFIQLQCPVDNLGLRSGADELVPVWGCDEALP